MAMRLVFPLLTVAFVLVLSEMIEPGATTHSSFIGIVKDVDLANSTLLVVGKQPQSDHGGLRLALSATTAYQDERRRVIDPSLIQRGTRVKLSLRCISGNHPVCIAAEVTLLTPALR